MKRFWNISENGGENTLTINGYIAEESWFSDDVTPKQFEDDLKKIKGDLTVRINSGGGDCFSAARIYTMLKEHDGKITVKIDSIAASAASVVAMAGDTVLMSPTAVIMIHNPASLIFGEVADLEQGIEMLTEVKEAIINAYELKTKLPRATISEMMDAVTSMSAQMAIDLGFADDMLFKDDNSNVTVDAYMWSSKSAVMATVNAMRHKLRKKTEQTDDTPKTPVDILDKRLSLLKY